MRGEVGGVVEGEALDAVDDGGFQVEDYLPVDGFEDRLEVLRDEVYVVDEVEAGDFWGWGKGFLGVVDEPRGGVGVVGWGWVLAFVEEEHVDVHGVPEGVVLASVVLGLEEDAHALAGGDSDVSAPNVVLFEPDPIDFDDRHVVLIEQEGMAGEVAYAKDTDEIGFVWLHVDGGVRGSVDQSNVGSRFIARVVFFVTLRLVCLEEVWHLLVIPVREGNRELAINFVGIGRVGIVDYQRPPQSVRVLTMIVRVVPVGT